MHKNTQKNPKIQALATFFRMMNTNGAAHVYRQAHAHGILDKLKTGPKTAGQVAREAGTSPRPTELLLNTLVAMGVVGHKDGQYTISPMTAALLEGRHNDLGDGYWTHLSEFLEHGEALSDQEVKAQPDAFHRRRAEAFSWMLAPVAEAAAVALGVGGTPATEDIDILAEAPSTLHVLDVGAGSGIFSLTIASKHPGAQITAVDWPSALEVGEQLAKRLSLASRYQTIAGDYDRIDLPESRYELALISNIAHLEPPQNIRALFAKVRDALKPGGRIVIIDAFPGDPAGDLNRTLYALAVSLRNTHSHLYSPEELEKLLEQVGLVDAKLINLKVPPYAMGMLVAQRPK